MKSVAAGLTLAVAIFAAAWFMRGGVESREPSQADSAGGNRGRGPQLPPTAVLSIAPVPGVPAAAESRAKPGNSQLVRDMLWGRNLKATYDRLQASASRSAEESFVLARILQSCGRKKDSKNRSVGAIDRAEARDRFLAALAPQDPFREKRIRAFDETNVDTCAGFAGLEYADEEIQALLAAGASGGDPKARLAQLERELFAQTSGGKARLMSMPDATVAAVKELVASGDPEAARNAASLLTLPFDNFSLRAGPNQLPVDRLAFRGAAQLLACEMGAACGADSRDVLRACANRGQCAADNYRDFLFFYELPPSASQLVFEYHRELSRAARERDWSYFTFHNAPDPGYASFAAMK